MLLMFIWLIWFCFYCYVYAMQCTLSPISSALSTMDIVHSLQFQISFMMAGHLAGHYQVTCTHALISCVCQYAREIRFQKAGVSLRNALLCWTRSPPISPIAMLTNSALILHICSAKRDQKKKVFRLKGSVIVYT